MRLTTLLMVFSLVGCAVTPPNTDVCVVNGPEYRRKCFNLSTDYDKDGRRKPTAQPVYRTNFTIQDLNKATVIDSPTGFEDGLANLKRYIKDLRQECKQ